MAIENDFFFDYFPVKRIYHSGSSVSTYHVNELYSYAQDTFDEPQQADDSIPMQAITPTQHKVINGWFIDDESVKFLYGSSLESDGWEDALGGGIIRKIFYTPETEFAESDIGLGLTGSDTSWAANILAFNTGSNELWLRPETTESLFSSGSENYTVGGSSASGSFVSASITGENLWPNVYTIGSTQPNTNIYAVQNHQKLAAWWPSGSVDILVKVRDFNTFIDSGLVTLAARQYTKLYNHNEIDLSGGGRSAVALGTAADSNNTEGYRAFSFNNGSAVTMSVGEVIQEDAGGSKRGVITELVTPEDATGTVTYYLIGDILNDFEDLDNVTALTSGKTFDVNGAPSDASPATLSGSITIMFGNVFKDIGNGNGLRPYACRIGCASQSLADVFQFCKYVTRRGSDYPLNGYNGEQYIAVGELFLEYTGQTSNFTEGLVITGSNSSASGYLVADADTGSVGSLILRDVEGTFEDGEFLFDSTTGAATASVGAAGLDLIQAEVRSPFGIFAGSSMFGARGVLLDDLNAADIKNYALLDSENVTQIPPNNVAFELTNIASGSEVRIYRVSDGVELAGNESVDNPPGTFTYVYLYTGDTPVFIVIHALDYVWQSLSITLGSSDASIPISQDFDRNYQNPV